MNYDEMSDFEINKLVAECLFKSYDTMTISVNDKSSVYVDGGDSEFYDYVSGEFDYCNNPNDAWPIIFDNKITIGWYCGDKWRAECDNQFVPAPYKQFTSLDENPLKAAMICFLKMKELENAHTS